MSCRQKRILYTLVQPGTIKLLIKLYFGMLNFWTLFCTEPNKRKPLNLQEGIEIFFVSRNPNEINLFQLTYFIVTFNLNKLFIALQNLQIHSFEFYDSQKSWPRSLHINLFTDSLAEMARHRYNINDFGNGYVGDVMCCWQFWNVTDRFEKSVTIFFIVNVSSNLEKVTNMITPSPLSRNCHRHKKPTSSLAIAYSLYPAEIPRWW